MNKKLDKVENKEIKRRGRPKKVVETPKEEAKEVKIEETNEMVKDIEHISEEMIKLAKKHPHGALYAMYVPNVDDKDYEKFKNMEDGIKGVRLIRTSCNANTLKVLINSFEETIAMFKTNIKMRKTLEKLKDLFGKAFDDEEEED